MQHRNTLYYKSRNKDNDSSKKDRLLQTLLIIVGLLISASNEILSNSNILAWPYLTMIMIFFFFTILVYASDSSFPELEINSFSRGYVYLSFSFAAIITFFFASKQVISIVISIFFQLALSFVLLSAFLIPQNKRNAFSFINSITRNNKNINSPYVLAGYFATYIIKKHPAQIVIFASISFVFYYYLYIQY